MSCSLACILGCNEAIPSLHRLALDIVGKEFTRVARESIAWLSSTIRFSKKKQALQVRTDFLDSDVYECIRIVPNKSWHPERPFRRASSNSVAG